MKVVTSNPGVAPDDGEENLRSRTDARRERKDSEESLMRLAWSLVELPERSLGRLDLPEALLDVIVRARLVPDGGPKNRALRLVRIMLRDGDAQAIADALRDIHELPRRSAAQAPPSEAERWRDKLIGGGEETITEYVSAFPDADRRNLRQLVRNARKASDAARADALATLTKALRQSMK